ncbi:MAG: hypothetical protein OEY31_07685 [Candidatus Bathyarchaeota archaeon]|nr:hypothetical protein [Candidatus Bathyarchaeota archaeon]
MVKITIIGGGSSTFTPQLMRLFLESNVLSGSTITLMDVDPRRLGVMTALSERLIENEKADLQIESSTDQRESLVNADFVITAISVGGFDAWEKDIEIPAKHGVYMPIADSIGPGGMMRAFRHIPVLVSVCRDLEDVSPEAWVFNYTNPVTANTMAMNRKSSIRTVGLCTCSSIPRDSGYLADLIDIKPEDLLVPAPAGGLNHCAAILELRFKDGKDAFPLLKEKVKNPIQRWGLENYDVLPYCWSHWTEFFPSLCQLDEEYNGRLQGLKMKYGMKVHNMEHERTRAKKWEKLVEEMSQGRAREVSLASLPKAESVEVVEIIEAILENRNEIHVVNVPNKGAIENLPENAIVEVSTVVGGYGIQPIHVGKLPDPLAATLSNHITVQELTVEAALTGDRNVAFKAFLQDPQISSKLTPEKTRRMLDEMLNAHAGHLSSF